MGRLNGLGKFDKDMVLEVARMSYGTSKAAAGGTGHIGLLNPSGTGAGGKCRVVKFDTHGGSSSCHEAKTSSNNLREELARITKESYLSKPAKDFILKLLLMDEKNAKKADKPLLERKIAAKVVEGLAGHSVWKLAKAGQSGYATKAVRTGKADFVKVVAGARGDTANVRTLKESRPVAGAEPNKEDVVSRRREAWRELMMFQDLAALHIHDKEKFYIRCTKDGTGLESAGKYRRWRTAEAKRQNREVRQRLLDCVRVLFNDDPPDLLPAILKNFRSRNAEEPLEANMALIIADHARRAIISERDGKSVYEEFKDVVNANNLNRLPSRDALIENSRLPKGKRKTMAQLRAAENLPGMIEEKDGVGSNFSSIELAMQRSASISKSSKKKVEG